MAVTHFCVEQLPATGMIYWRLSPVLLDSVSLFLMDFKINYFDYSWLNIYWCQLFAFGPGHSGGSVKLLSNTTTQQTPQLPMTNLHLFHQVLRFGVTNRFTAYDCSCCIRSPFYILFDPSHIPPSSTNRFLRQHHHHLCLNGSNLGLKKNVDTVGCRSTDFKRTAHHRIPHEPQRP